MEWQQWPDQRILYMSAHPAEVLVRHGLTSLDVPFLAKPYTPDAAGAFFSMEIKVKDRLP